MALTFAPLVYVLDNASSAAYRATFHALRVLGTDCRTLRPGDDIAGFAYVLVPPGADTGSLRREYRVRNVFLSLLVHDIPQVFKQDLRVCRNLLDTWRATCERPRLISEDAFARAVESSQVAEARYLSHELRRHGTASEAIRKRALALLQEARRPLPQGEDDPRLPGRLLEELARFMREETQQ